MNKILFKAGMFVATLLCNALPFSADAQDTHWLMAGDKRLTFTSGSPVISSITSTWYLPDYIGPRPRTVFNNNGDVLFSYGTNSTMLSGGYIDEGGQSAFAIPDSCNYYYVVGTGYVTTPHGSYLRLTKVNASGSFPTSTSTYLNMSGHPLYYGSTAAPGPNGKHYVYHLSGNPGGIPNGCYLDRYEISSNGTINMTPTWTYNPSATPLPHIMTGTKVAMAPSGDALGYVDISGNVVVVKGLGTATPSFMQLTGGTTGTIYGLMAMEYFSIRRWYITTGSTLGFYLESSGSYWPLSTTTGLKSELSQGPDQMIYFADGNPASGSGTLYKFIPGATAANFTAATTAVSGGTNVVPSNGAYFSFGNIVHGENINAVYNNASADFTINNATRSVPSSCSPQVISCPATPTLRFNTPLNAGQQYKIGWIETNSCGIPVTPSTLGFTTDTWHYGNPGSVNLTTYGNGTLGLSAIEGKYFVVSVTTKTNCGGGEQTQTALIKFEGWSANLAQWNVTMTTGGALGTPGGTCASPLQFACNRYPAIKASMNLATQYWMVIKYYPGGNCSATPITIADGSGSPDVPAPSPSTNTIQLQNYVLNYSTDPSLYDDLFFRSNPNSLIEVTLFMKNACVTSSVVGYFRNNSTVNCKGDGTTGVDELDASSINVSPNPANNVIKVSLNDISLDQLSEMSLLDITGKYIMNVKTNMKKLSNNSFQLDVQSLPEGMYIYKYIVGNRAYNGKISIVH